MEDTVAARGIPEGKGPGGGLSGSAIKIIAIIAMAIDHIGAVVLERMLMAGGLGEAIADPAALEAFMMQYGGLYLADLVLRLVGRIAFPLFCFLLVEGFCHTHSVARYLRNMVLFALASEIPFDIAVYGSWFSLQGQNVFFTLALGVAVVAALRQVEQRSLSRLQGTVLSLMAVGAGCAAAVALKSDYAAWGVLVIVLMYLLRDQRMAAAAAGCLALLPMGLVQVPAFLSLIPIRFYNGRRGLRLKYLFYLFYPAHLLALYGVAVLLGYGAAF